MRVFFLNPGTMVKMFITITLSILAKTIPVASLHIRHGGGLLSLPFQRKPETKWVQRFAQHHITKLTTYEGREVVQDPSSMLVATVLVI